MSIYCNLSIYLFPLKYRLGGNDKVQICIYMQMDEMVVLVWIYFHLRLFFGMDTGNESDQFVSRYCLKQLYGYGYIGDEGRSGS